MGRLHTPLLNCILAALFSNAASGDFITGRVVDANGVGVPGVDIDVENLGSGGDPLIFNDGTDASGYFMTTVPYGVYRVLFKPPPPPTTTHLTAIVDNVVVFGTEDMGVITLPPGVGILGRCVDPLGFPVANVNLDVTDLSTGTELVLKNGTTDLFGLFGVAVPKNAIHLDFDTQAVFGQTLVPIRMNLSPSTETNLGDVSLPSGFLLGGTLHTTLGVPVPGVDLDVFDAKTGVKLYTPHDNSNLLGSFSLTLPPGVFDIEICPPFSALLVGLDQEGFPLLANTDLGILTLETGVVLSGTVRDVAGTPVAGMDVDVADSLTLFSVVTCGDNTDALGNYAVVVPTGTLDVGFAPPGQHGTTAENLHTSVTIAAATILDGVIPAPSAEFQGTPLVGLVPLPVTFTDLSTGAVSSRSWNFGDGAVSSLAAPTHVYSSPGRYDVSLLANGIGGPSIRTELSYVDVQVPPAASLVATPQVGTAPLTVAFSDTSAGSLTSWSWDFGELSTSALQNPTHTYAHPGTYTVSLTVTGPFGTSTSVEPDFVVVSHPPPIAHFTGAPLDGRVPLTVTFTDLSMGVVTGWSWDFGEGGSSLARNPVYTYDTPGLYTVALSAIGPGGSHTRTEIGYVRVRPRRRAPSAAPGSGVVSRPAPLSGAPFVHRVLSLASMRALLSRVAPRLAPFLPVVPPGAGP